MSPASGVSYVPGTAPRAVWEIAVLPWRRQLPLGPLQFVKIEIHDNKTVIPMVLPAVVKGFIPVSVQRLVKQVLKLDRYDGPTRAIIRRHLKPDSNAADIGANKGDILDTILAAAPKGRHMAFEPLPGLARRLKFKYADRAEVRELALSDGRGEVEFTRVIGHEDYSGFRKRPLKGDWKTEIIRVRRAPLTDVWPMDLPLHLIKLDVEGAQLEVLRGAVPLLKQWKPVIVFEHGPGASKVYGTTSYDVFDVLAECGLSIWLLEAWLRQKEPLQRQEFSDQVEQKVNYYFVAGPAA
jgi:FkbM family methyltransferase